MTPDDMNVVSPWDVRGLIYPPLPSTSSTWKSFISVSFCCVVVEVKNRKLCLSQTWLFRYCQWDADASPALYLWFSKNIKAGQRDGKGLCSYSFCCCETEQLCRLTPSGLSWLCPHSFHADAVLCTSGNTLRCKVIYPLSVFLFFWHRNVPINCYICRRDGKKSLRWCDVHKSGWKLVLAHTDALTRYRDLRTDNGTRPQ